METVFRAAPTRTPDPPFSTTQSGSCYSLSVNEHLRPLNIAAQITTQIKIKSFLEIYATMKIANGYLKITETKKILPKIFA
jgi:hypothetical protein